MESTLERIEAIEKNQLELSGKLDQVIGLLGEVQSTSQQVNATEQSVVALGRTLTAALKVLVSKAVLTSGEVMNEIVAIDSKNDQEELERMKASGHLLPSDKVTDESVVVVSQNFVSPTKPEDCRTVSEFVLIRMPLPTMSPQLRARLQGRVTGDSVPTSKTPDGGYYMLNIKEVYKLNFEKQGGEGGGHASDCATHNEPATPNGPCDCDGCHGCDKTAK